MESRDYEKTFSEHKRDTSVPVGEKGERTGFPRPSASNCSTHLVESQARVSAWKSEIVHQTVPDLCPVNGSKKEEQV